MTPLYPSLYQINTRVWLTKLSRTLGRPATLDDIPDIELDRLAQLGFDWVWLLSVWQTGPAAQAISRANPEWRREFQATLPDRSRSNISDSSSLSGCSTISGSGPSAFPMTSSSGASWPGCSEHASPSSASGRDRSAIRSAAGS